MTMKLNRVRVVVKVHVRAKYQQAECSGSWVFVLANFLPYLGMVKNPKIRFCDLDLWPMTLKFNRVRAVVKVHVPAKFHRVILRTEKKTLLKTLQSIATTWTVIIVPIWRPHATWNRCVLYGHEELELSLFQASSEVLHAYKSHSERIAGAVDPVEMIAWSVLVGEHQLALWELKARLVVRQGRLHLHVRHLGTVGPQFKVVRQAALRVHVRPAIAQYPRPRISLQRHSYFIQSSAIAQYYNDNYYYHRPLCVTEMWRFRFALSFYFLFTLVFAPHFLSCHF